jgi:NAD(P)-dependent dehydrogenase (short-subunit alcohol dehydrogenase family)
VSALAGRTCVVTGATSGIGLEAALGLAKQGARVVIVGRNPAKTEAVLREIRERSGNEAVEAALADLASQAAIRGLAKELEARCPRIDVLLNNAGVVTIRRETTPDGIETVFGVNHLGYFLLTLLLLDRLKASAPARIVNVASEAHRFAKLDFANLQAEQGWSFMRQYGLSKLGNILFSYELARRLEGMGVTVNCLHPGAVGTNLGTNNGWLGRAVMTLGRPFLRTPAQGADTAIWLASSPEVEGVTGKYFVKRREKRTSPVSYERDAQARLWVESERLAQVAPSTP